MYQNKADKFLFVISILCHLSIYSTNRAEMDALMQMNHLMKVDILQTAFRGSNTIANSAI
ncbi:MAG TPA: hypothetical protein VIK14_03180 [Ignavibacteria bacterium]